MIVAGALTICYAVSETRQAEDASESKLEHRDVSPCDNGQMVNMRGYGTL